MTKEEITNLCKMFDSPNESDWSMALFLVSRLKQDIFNKVYKESKSLKNYCTSPKDAKLFYKYVSKTQKKEKNEVASG